MSLLVLRKTFNFQVENTKLFGEWDVNVSTILTECIRREDSE